MKKKTEKKCSTCLIVLSLEFFRPRHNQCKVCTRATQRMNRAHRKAMTGARHSKNYRLSEAEIEAAKILLESGKTQLWVANLLDCSQATISKEMK